MAIAISPARAVCRFTLRLVTESPTKPAENYSTLEAISLLLRAARRLDLHHTNACNREISPREERDRQSWERRAREAAALFGLLPFFQRDPRGSPLYLLKKEDIEGRDHTSVDYYGHGIVVPCT